MHARKRVMCVTLSPGPRDGVDFIALRRYMLAIARVREFMKL